MGNNENEFGLTDAAPEGKIELLQPPTPLKNDGGHEQGRVPWANETHQENPTFQVALMDNSKQQEQIQPLDKDRLSQSNWMNKYENKQIDVLGKENKEPVPPNKPDSKNENIVADNWMNRYGNKQIDVLGKENKELLPPNKTDSQNEKPVADNWVNRYENKANNFYGGTSKQNEKQYEKGEQVEKIEGKKVAYNEDNNKAKGKSLFEIKAASSTQNVESIKPIQQQGQNTSFGDLVKKSIPENSVKIQKKPEQLVNQVKPVTKEQLIKPPPQNTEQKLQSNDKPPIKSFTEMVRNTIKSTPPPTPPKGPKR